MACMTIPRSLLPADGRFGSGPSKVRPEQIGVLSEAGRTLLGTSHRQTPVKRLVASIRQGLADFFPLPEGYEVALGNGGTSAFWEVACASLIESRAAFGRYGSFSARFARAAQRAPFLEQPLVVSADPGSCRIPEASEGIDAYCWAQNETSTGVQAPVRRISGGVQRALTLIDATSGAGALPVDLSQTDVYYFSPQKAFGSDGGLWVAVLSPAAIERAERVEQTATRRGSTRWVPRFLSLTAALQQSRKDQTLNTPAIATLILMANQIGWLNAHGGLRWAAERSARSAELLYSWAERVDYAEPFVSDKSIRSHSVVTIDLDDSLDTHEVQRVLRNNGIVDVGGYRGLARNQLRVGVFPSVDPADVAALTRCIDYVATHL